MNEFNKAVSQEICLMQMRIPFRTIYKMYYAHIIDDIIIIPIIDKKDCTENDKIKITWHLQ